MSAASLHPPANGSPTTNGEHAPGTPETPSPQTPPDRDAHGRFRKGNGGGPGNPFARQTAAMRKVVCAEVSKEDLAAMTRKLKEMALAGNMAALKLLFTYVVGRPTDAVDPDTLDLQEWSQLRQAPAMLEEMPKVVKCLTPEDACFLARNTQPAVSEEMLTQLGTAMQKQNDREARARERQQARREQKQTRSDAAMPTGAKKEQKPAETQQPPSGNGDIGFFPIKLPTVQELQAEVRQWPMAREQETVSPRTPAPSGNGANGGGGPSGQDGTGQRTS